MRREDWVERVNEIESLMNYTSEGAEFRPLIDAIVLLSEQIQDLAERPTLTQRPPGDD